MAGFLRRASRTFASTRNKHDRDLGLVREWRLQRVQHRTNTAKRMDVTLVQLTGVHQCIYDYALKVHAPRCTAYALSNRQTCGSQVAEFCQPKVRSAPAEVLIDEDVDPVEVHVNYLLGMQVDEAESDFP